MPRFLNYGRKQMVEHCKSNMMRLIVLFASLLVIFLWSGYLHYSSLFTFDGKLITDGLGTLDPFHSSETKITAFLFFLMGCNMASLMMYDLKTKSGKIAVLTTPASPFENWFFRWLFFTVLYVAVFVLFYWLADLIRVGVFRLWYPQLHHNIYTLGVGTLLDRINAVTDNEPIYLYAYFYIQSVCVLGSSFFPRHSLLRTTTLLLSALIVYALFVSLIAKSIGGASFGPDSLNMFQGFLLFLTVFNWIISYFRFKEMEVIDRL